MFGFFKLLKYGLHGPLLGPPFLVLYIRPNQSYFKKIPKSLLCSEPVGGFPLPIKLSLNFSSWGFPGGLAIRTLPPKRKYNKKK